MVAEAKYVTAALAGRYARVSVRTLARLAEAGTIARRKTDGGAWEYSSEDAKRYGSGKEAESVDSDALLGQAYSAIKDLQAPSRMFVEALQEEMLRLRDRCRYLEERHDQLVTTREQWLNQQHERDMANAMLKGIEERKERAFKAVERYAIPKLVSSFGGNDDIVKLLQSFDEAQIELLLNTELVTEEQKKLLRKLFEEKLGAKFEESEEPAEQETASA